MCISSFNCTISMCVITKNIIKEYRIFYIFIFLLFQRSRFGMAWSCSCCTTWASSPASHSSISSPTPARTTWLKSSETKHENDIILLYRVLHQVGSKVLHSSLLRSSTGRWTDTMLLCSQERKKLQQELLRKHKQNLTKWPDGAECTKPSNNHKSCIQECT